MESLELTSVSSTVINVNCNKEKSSKLAKAFARLQLMNIVLGLALRRIHNESYKPS